MPTVVWVPIDQITPYIHNNKQHPQSQIDKLASCIIEYGFDVPIVVDEDNVILKGHGRRMAALKLGLTEVPVIKRTDLTPAQKKACRIADNKVAESPWDFEALKLEMAALDEMNFDLQMTGFSLEECSSLFDLGVIDFQGKQIFGEDGPPTPPEPDTSHELDEGRSPQFSRQDAHDDDDQSELERSDGSLLELVEIVIAEPRHQVQRGQVWQLGNHVLVVADVLTGWQSWKDYLSGDAIFAPYPGPFVPLTVKGEERRLVMVQPDEYIAGHILDQYENVKGAGSVQRG
nr:ParB/Srx family N-terminal domain-containing protein [Leptolyngbya sp. FACHB-541]